jgi:hypothetical protein
MSKSVALLLVLVFMVASCLSTVEPAWASSKMQGQTFGGPNDDALTAMVHTSDGGYALLGTTTTSNSSDKKCLLVKTDASGKMEWNQTIGLSHQDLLGSLIQTSDGGYALAGQKDFAIYGERYSTGGKGLDFWLIKTDEYGKIEWNRTYGGSAHDGLASLIATSDGGYALAGKSTTGYFSTVYSWFIKTDLYGKKEWMQKYTEGRFGSLIETSDGGFALAGAKLDGNESLDFWLIKTNASGIMEWNQTYGGEAFDSASSLVETSDGGFALAGVTESFGAGGTDFWLIKTDGYGIVPESPSPTSSPEPIETWLFTTILVVASVFTVAVVGIGLLVYFKKRKR